MNSGRTFDYLLINMASFDKQSMDNLIKVVEIHGAAIKRLVIRQDKRSAYKVETKDAIEFLQNLPNLVEWNIYGTCNIFSDILGKCEPVLFNLKRIRFTCETVVCEKLFSFIGSDTLEFLNINSEMIYEKFIRRQRKLKFLECTYKYMPECLNSMKSLNLEQLECFPDETDEQINEEPFLQLIREHEQLQKIIMYANISATVVETICHRSQFLQSLFFNLSNDNVASLAGIYHLKKLQEFEISFAYNFNRFDLLRDMARLKMPTIKNVSFLSQVEVAFDLDSIYRRLGSRWKNIEKFTSEINHQSISTILVSFKSLKSLSVCHTSLLPEFHNGCTYPCLERLTITDGDRIRFSNFNLFINLLQALPNLSYLNFSRKCECKDAHQLEVLVKVLPKLRYLRIQFDEKFEKILKAVTAIKTLCGSLQGFVITFDNPKYSQFTRWLATFFEKEDCIKQEFDRGTHGGERLILKNFKY